MSLPRCLQDITPHNRDTIKIPTQEDNVHFLPSVRYTLLHLKLFSSSLSLTTTLSHDVVLKNAFHHISCNAIPLISVMASCSSLFVTSNISRRDELFFPQLVTHRLQATLVKLVKIYSRIKYTSILCNTLLCYLTQHITFVGNQKHVGFQL